MLRNSGGGPVCFGSPVVKCRKSCIPEGRLSEKLHNLVGVDFQ
ncbi:hypothetical protein HMPREF0297_0193 [Corynebacterium jeikeium ATCC 43734]|nr:hypothetical protein HMPREF0297_0193 [Corynebacterium jeikeium ATCC 43734]